MKLEIRFFYFSNSILILGSPKDLIKKLLVINPIDRLTVTQALEHPFFHVKVRA